MQNRFYFKGSFSNIYKKSSKSSEVTSQILYGEKFKILSKNKNWIKIKSDFDNYTGYIQNKNYSKEFRANYKVSSLKAIIYKKPNLKTNIFLSLGSKLSVKETNKNYARIDKNKWIKKKDINATNATVAKAAVISSAITAIANNNSDLPVHAKTANNRFVIAINPPAKNMVFIVPALMAITPPIKVNTTVVIQPKPFE